MLGIGFVRPPNPPTAGGDGFPETPTEELLVQPPPAAASGLA